MVVAHDILKPRSMVVTVNRLGEEIVWQKTVILASGLYLENWSNQKLLDAVVVLDGSLSLYTSRAVRIQRGEIMAGEEVKKQVHKSIGKLSSLNTLSKRRLK